MRMHIKFWILTLLLVLAARCYVYHDMNMIKAAVFVAYHKDYEIVENDVVIPIQAGRALHPKYGENLETKMIGDNTGDNISEKNMQYCELTAMYWVWKNVRNLDVVGFMHYHRFFNNIGHDEICGADDKLCKLGLTQKQMSRLFSTYDIVIPIPYNMNMTGYEYYSQWHYREDMDIAINYIRRNYPEMSAAVDEALFNTHYRYFANLMIMKREIFDEYAKWLFDILFAIENDIGPKQDKILSVEANPTVEYQQRAPGFLAEILFDVWLAHNRKRFHVIELHTLTE